MSTSCQTIFNHLKNVNSPYKVELKRISKSIKSHDAESMLTLINIGSGYTEVGGQFIANNQVQLRFKTGLRLFHFTKFSTISKIVCETPTTATTQC
jgi:hypothetical protein